MALSPSNPSATAAEAARPDGDVDSEPDGHPPSLPPERRVGLGADTHRLQPGDGLWIGGVLVEADVASRAHSDGDAALHALCDALLSAAGFGADLGDLFPDNDPVHANRASADFVAAVVARVAAAGWRVENAAVVVHLERPRLGLAKEAIRARLASLLNVDADRVGLTAKSGEGVGAVGRREAWRADAVALLIKETE